jgi:hypothetical protein
MGLLPAGFGDAGVTAWVIDWLCAFGVTFAVEATVALPLLRPSEASLGRRLAAVALANLATHPLVWFLFPGLALTYTKRLVLSETFAVLVETGVYLVIWPALGPRRTALVAVVANGASLTLGLLLRSGGWLQ